MRNRPARFGKGPTERTHTTGTSPAAYFTLREWGAEMRSAYPAMSECRGVPALKEDELVVDRGCYAVVIGGGQ